MLRQLIIAGCLALAAVQVHAAEAGKIIFVAGHAHVAGTAAAEGGPVQEGEMLSTGADGFLYVKTADDGLFILRPNTRARIVTYRIDRQNPANTRVKLELISGIARSKSGNAVKQARQNFRFNTPVAAIGVRGTDFTVFTDQDTSRVAVLTGGVVVSGFAGGCRPEGGGPCEGATSRELFAAQRGQMLEIKRGDSAPEVKPATNAPDQVSPPRGNEPVAKQGGATDPSVPVIDARKSSSLEKLVSNQPPTPVDPVSPPPPVTPPVTPPETTPETPPVTPPETTPIDPGTPGTPIEVPPPPLPERSIVWGRWVALAGSPETVALADLDRDSTMMKLNYAIARSGAGRDYVAPERGNASFTLKGGEAVVQSHDSGAASFATLRNGVLAVDFGNATFTTSFDLVDGSDVHKMMADGAVARDGRFGNSAFARPNTNNMSVDGMLSNADGGSAAYIFTRRLDENRMANGVTVWGRQQ